MDLKNDDESYKNGLWKWQPGINNDLVLNIGKFLQSKRNKKKLLFVIAHKKNRNWNEGIRNYIHPYSGVGKLENTPWHCITSINKK